MCMERNDKKMYLKNKDLLLLLDIDRYIIKTLDNNNDGKILHDELTTLLYQLLNTKKQANKKNYDRIKEKRKKILIISQY